MNENKAKTGVIIIGGGPAGLSAALWCRELGMKTTLLEKGSEFGGQLLRIYGPIKNYIGVEAENGLEMRDIFLRAAGKREFVRRLNANILDLDTANNSVILHTGEIHYYKALIIAAGVRRKKLGAEGEEKFQGKGIIDSGSDYREKAKGKKTVIVGGGDAAIENALILAEFASKVSVVNRGENFRARGEFLEKAKRHPRIELYTNTIIKKFSGDPIRAASGSGQADGQTLAAVETEDLQTSKLKIMPAEIALIRIGVQPNSEILSGKVELDPNGYVIVNTACESSTAGVFAIGDIANPVSPTISTAAGTAATAAKNALNWISNSTYT